MPIAKLTPILIVKSIEECLPFWLKTLGYEVVSQVPAGEKMGFVILKKGELEAMLQSEASLAKDLPALVSNIPTCGVFLYADVPSLDEALDELHVASVVVPRRKTDYGAEEVWVKTESGHVIGLAEIPN